MSRKRRLNNKMEKQRRLKMVMKLRRLSLLKGANGLLPKKYDLIKLYIIGT